MTVYKSLQKIASEAANISVGLVKGEKLNYKTVKVDNVESVLLDPIVLTKGNMDLLVKDGFFTKDSLPKNNSACNKGVTHSVCSGGLRPTE